MPYGYYFLNNLMTLMPSIITKHLIDDMSGKLVMSYSNVPGPREPWTFLGKRSSAGAFNIPLSSTIGCGWGIMSSSNFIKATFVADRAAVPDV
jgi:hypothetical protein